MSEAEESGLYYESYTSPQDAKRVIDELNYNHIAEQAKKNSLGFKFEKEQLKSIRNRYSQLSVGMYIVGPLSVYLVRRPIYRVFPIGCFFISAIYFQLKSTTAKLQMMERREPIQAWANVSRRADQLLFDIRYRPIIDIDLQKKRVDDDWKTAKEKRELPAQTKEMNDFVRWKMCKWLSRRQV